MSTKQYAERVVNFSSQYGMNKTSSYVAENLSGGRSVPSYGDHTQAFVLRSYGLWWKKCPSAAPKLKKTAPSFQSEDFAELEYEKAVIPTAILIYETYHPGSVVRVLACNASAGTKDSPGKVKWVTLWSGSPQCKDLPQELRTFSPPLKKISFPTKLIRLEFNSSDCQYYTELDAVELAGEEPQNGLIGMLKDRAEGFQVALTSKLLRQLSLTERQTSISEQEDEFDQWGYFSFLSDEVIQLIMSFLDIVSLSNLAQTCSLLLKNAYDPLLYSDLDLQSRWNTVDDVALQSLVSRCSNLQQLNLSWTGGGGQITEQAVCSFLKSCGSQLKTLRLACCQYVHKETLRTVARVCKQLEELDLQSCTQLEWDELVYIADLSNLKRLNLYCMNVDKTLLTTIGKCSKLEHLNLGASTISHSKPVLSRELAQCLSHLKNLISLDLWRCKFAEADVIKALANHCPELQELDIGWCSRILSRNYDFPSSLLCSKCVKLKKLFLTSGRCICDEDLLALAKHCPELEQFDILGSSRVRPEAVKALCKACPKLYFFDLSFSSQLTDDVVLELRQAYPHICFKKSFQLTDNHFF